ncbi:MAG: HEAT repeat domain-containing protein [Lentisphaeria bacterium]|nr:HEAT repeat domain-containing protein [Lentisphaeria bacterium]
MKHFKKGLLLLIVAILALTLYLLPTQKNSPDLSKVKNVEKEIVILAKKAEEINISSKPAIIAPMVSPGIFAKFDSLEQSKRFDFIKENLRNYNLTDVEYNWLKKQIKDKGLYIVTRNDMCSMLVNQKKKDPDLYLTFIDFYEDKSESPKWRDYAVQFIGQSLPLTENDNDKEGIYQVLLDIAKYDTTLIPGTAMLQLAQQESHGNIKLDKRYDQLMDWYLSSDKTKESIKISLIGIIAKRKTKKHLPMLREIIKTSERIGMRRASIATIGLIGDKSDIELIKPYLQDENKLVVMAAKAATVRLKKL